MSLLSAAERLAAMDRSTVTLVANRCLHTRDKLSECTACFDICPVGAITPGQPPTLNTKQCQTCLACLPACPMGTFTADDAVPALLNCAGRLESKAIELVCELHPSAEKGITPDSVGVRVRGCLAGLGSGAYPALAALGLEQVLVRTDFCQTCILGALQAKIESQVSHASRLLTVWGKAEMPIPVSVLGNAIERPLWNADNPPLSRRDLFRMAARQGKVAMARAIENEHTVTETRPGRDRMRLLGAVAHLPDCGKNTTNLGEMNYASLSVRDTCTACGVCARACPAGALSFKVSDDESAYVLQFIPRKCIGCEICAHVCAQAALLLNHAPDFDQIFGLESANLREGPLARCESCKVLYAAQPDTHLCIQCEYRRTNPFGSRLPPGFKPGKIVTPQEPRQ